MLLGGMLFYVPTLRKFKFDLATTYMCLDVELLRILKYKKKCLAQSFRWKPDPVNIRH